MKKLLWLLPLLWSGTAHATCSSVPNTFVPNTTIQSSQVNANFTALVTCINGIDAGQITTGTLSVARGGTGSTSFTGGSVVFAAGSVLGQDNANFFWDGANHRLLIGDTSVVSSTAPTLQVVLAGSNTTAISAPYSSSQIAFALNPVSSGGWAMFDGVGGTYHQNISASNGAVFMARNLSVAGDLVLTNSPAGSIVADGTVTTTIAIQKSGGGNLTAINLEATNVTTTNNFTVDGSLFVGTSGTLSLSDQTSGTIGITSGTGVGIAGHYIFLNSASRNCTINSTGGPCIFADANTIVDKLPSGTNGWEVQSGSGTVLAQLVPAGNLSIVGTYQINGANLLNQTGTYSEMYDGAGTNIALLLGASGDQQNYYRNTVHRIQSIGGVSDFATINSAGIVVPTGYVSASTGSGFNGYQFSTNPATNCCAIEQTSGNTVELFSTGSNANAVVLSDGANSVTQIQATGTPSAVEIQAGGGTCSYIGGSSFSCSSDRVLKQNIAVLPSAMADINKLSPVSFEMKARPGKTELGFIAQDVQTVFPDLVEVEVKSGELLLNETALIAPLLKAVQELDARVKTLEAK